MNSEELSIIFLMVSFSLFFLHHTCRGAACRGGICSGDYDAFCEREMYEYELSFLCIL